MFMTRRGILISTLVVAFLFFAAAQPTNAQLELVDTWIVAHTDGPTPPWTAEVGDDTEAFVYVNLCWAQGGFNPLEGEIKLVLEETSSAPPELRLEMLDTEETYEPAFLETSEQECGSQYGMRMVLEVISDFGDSISHTYSFTITGEVEGDIGTYTPPDPVTLQMNVVVEAPEDLLPPGGGGNQNGGNTNNEPEPEVDESPAPAFVLFAVFAMAVVTLLRRRE